jgi:hypothetical protein
MAWWANMQIAPIEAARELWTATLLQAEPASERSTAVATRRPGLDAKLDPGSDAESARTAAGRVSP